MADGFIITLSHYITFFFTPPFISFPPHFCPVLKALHHVERITFMIKETKRSYRDALLPVVLYYLINKTSPVEMLNVKNMLAINMHLA